MNGSSNFVSFCKEPWISDPCTTIYIGGISLSIYGLLQLSHTTPTSCKIIFCIHGRLADATQMDLMCRALCSIDTKLPIVSIAITHRNHGSRMVDPIANMGWSSSKPGNQNHVVDIAVTEFSKNVKFRHGTALDISFLIDHLPHHLNLICPVKVDSWGVAGISLGGHTALIAVMNDQRIDLAISIVGCGDYESLMHSRFNTFKSRAPSNKLGSWADVFPVSLQNLVHRVDPVHRVDILKERSSNLPAVIFLGGGNDSLVPVADNHKYWSAMEELYTHFNQLHRLKQFVDNDAKHECSILMAEKIVIWLHKLNE